MGVVFGATGIFWAVVFVAKFEQAGRRIRPLLR
jgi:hypothetical protein